jgi:aminoglycoside phosphotransferase (APT) family kinase protein
VAEARKRGRVQLGRRDRKRHVPHFRPIAVLDWEMAALAPRELDLSYCVYIHWMFQDAAQRYGGGAGGGMPHFMRPTDALTEYERITGYTPRDFEFYALWNATRYGMISARIGRRSAFAESPCPTISTT